MDISFNIQRYTEAETLEEWASIQQGNSQVARIKEVEYEIKLNPFEKIYLQLGDLLFNLFSSVNQIQKEKSFANFEERIHFEDINIRISSPLKEQNLSFLYKEIQDFVLCHKPNITIFRWRKSINAYQYTIYSPIFQNDLIQILEHLYAENVPVLEIDENGKKLHLLELNDKPLEKEVPIDEKYQRLIDEIGEKEDGYNNDLTLR